MAITRHVINLQRAKPCLDQLSNVWSSYTDTTQWFWDDQFGVYATARAKPTYEVTFGRGWFRGLVRLRHLTRSFVRQRRFNWRDRCGVQLRVPEDAIIFLRHSDARTIVVVSKAEGRVLKIDRPDVIDAEVKGIGTAQAAGLDGYVPRLFDQGFVHAPKKDAWMLTSILPNTHPLSSNGLGLLPLKGRFTSKWRGIMQTRLLPFLQIYYDQVGIEKVPVVRYVDQLTEQAEALTYSAPTDALFSALRKCEVASEECLLRSQIHGDIRPDHVHMSREGWGLIDWEKCRYDFILRDFFNEHVQVLSLNRAEVAGTLENKFWRWIGKGGEMHSLPSQIRKDLELVVAWHRAWRGEHLSSEAIRAFLLSHHIKNLMYFAGKEDYRTCDRTIAALGLK